jgi:fumarate reductase subunit D
MKKRSNAPIFWALFGAGGMLSALTGPVLVFIVGIAVPAGFLLSPQTMRYQRMLSFVQHPLGRAIVFVLIALFLWHAAHRIFKSLHDVGIHPGMAAKLACYGTALAATVVTAVSVLAV